MERLNKIIRCALVVTITSLMLCYVSFSALAEPNIAPNAQVQSEAELTERERDVERKLQKLDEEVKQLKEKENKVSQAERKKREESLKRKRAELKQQQEALKKSAEEAKKEAETAKKEAKAAREENENLKKEQANTAKKQAQKEKQLLIYSCIVGGIVFVIIIALIVVFVKRNKRAKQLEEELLFSSSEIENYKGQLEEAQKKQANATVRVPKGGRNVIAFIVIKNGMAVGQLSASFDTALTIGRAPDCGLRLDNEPTVSGHHCEIRSDGLAFYIRDLGSTNGTALNGVAINNSIKINNGDKILLGAVELIASGLPQSNTPSMTSNLDGATIRQRV